MHGGGASGHQVGPGQGHAKKTRAAGRSAWAGLGLACWWAPAARTAELHSNMFQNSAIHCFTVIEILFLLVHTFKFHRTFYNTNFSR